MYKSFFKINNTKGGHVINSAITRDEIYNAHILFSKRQHKKQTLELISKLIKQRKELERCNICPEIINAIKTGYAQSCQDIINYEQRIKIKEAIIANIENGRKNIFEYSGIDSISRRDFYRRKNKLLNGIADLLGFERVLTDDEQ